MSPHDSFMFPEFLPLGLSVRPYGGIKAEPQDVKAGSASSNDVTDWRAADIAAWKGCAVGSVSV